MSDATAVAERDAAGTEARVAPAGSVSTAAATPGHAVRSGLDRAGVFTASSPMLLRHSDDAEGLEAQVARGLVAALGQRGAAGSGAVTLRLSPESLGPLRIELDVQGASVMVRFVAQSVGVAERIDRAMPILRATLDAAGLELRGATTQVNAEARSDGGVQDHGRGDGGGRNGAATHGGGGAETPNVTDGRREPGSDREDLSRGGVRRGVRSTDRGVDREGDIGVVRAEPVRFSGVDGALVLGVDTLA